MPEDTDLQPCSLERINEIRIVLDQVTNKWAIMILMVLCPGPARFNAIKRALGEITHKSLTEALRRLERFGIVQREVIASSPVAVQYELTDLGRTLEEPISAMLQWSRRYASEVISAQRRFDEGTRDPREVSAEL